MGISCTSHFIYSKQKMFQFDLNKFETRELLLFLWNVKRADHSH